MLGLSHFQFIPVAPQYFSMMIRGHAKKHSKYIFNVDYSDEIFKEKISFQGISKSESTAPKQVFFPSINKPTEIPFEYLLEKGCEIR